jgi:hypothetical protein
MKTFGWILRWGWLDPKRHSQETPIGAIFLHWSASVLVILATCPLSPTDAYQFLVNMYSYGVLAIFELAIAIGVLKLRLSRRESWSRKATSTNSALSIISAVIVLLGSLFPVLASWVPPCGKFRPTTAYPWFTYQTVSLAVLAFGCIWFIGFLMFAAYRKSKSNKEFNVRRVPGFDHDEPPVLISEEVYVTWRISRPTLRTGVSLDSFDSIRVH